MKITFSDGTVSKLSAGQELRFNAENFKAPQDSIARRHGYVQKLNGKTCMFSEVALTALFSSEQVFKFQSGGSTMFEELFKYHAVVNRHRNAPLDAERERFLRQRQKEGRAADSWYKRIFLSAPLLWPPDQELAAVPINIIKSKLTHLAGP